MKASEIQQRREQITQLLVEDKKVKVSLLVEQFHVSDETIRKDLKYLEKQGISKTVYGGAVLDQSDSVAPVINRTTTFLDDKTKIVKRALDFLPEDACVLGLDQGSTVALLAHYLNQYRQKTIITSSLTSILELIHGSNDFYCAGGKYSKDDMSFQGDIASDTLNNVQIDIGFFGSSGVMNRDGICTSSFADAEMKRNMLAKCHMKIALIDHSKFIKSSFVKVTDWKTIDYVITDEKTPEELLEQVAAQTNVIIAK
jgi:DeoR/GlpR family transcriptional regulator of sugar metabolism